MNLKRLVWLYQSAELQPSEAVVILANKIIYVLSSWLYALKGLLVYGDAKVFPNYARHLPQPGKTKGRVLVAYLNEALHKEYFFGNVKYHFSNNGTPLSVVQAFNELGYVADCIDYKYLSFVPKKEYQALFFHDYESFDSLGGKLPGAKKILFETTAYFRPMEQKIRERMEYFYKRHQVRLPEEQYNHFLWADRIGAKIDRVTKSADGVVVIGDQLSKTFAGFPNARYLKNGVYLDKHQKNLTEQAMEAGRGNFLFFGGGRDVIRKGLDILFDVFIGSPYHLYVCMDVPEQIKTIYQLDRHPNIHLLGYMKIGSKKFRDILSRCNYVIQPSCAEGVPGGVLDVMKYGLIPIVTQECNIPEAEYCGHIFSDYSTEAVKAAVLEMSAKPAGELLQLAQSTRQVIEQNYNPRAFVEQLKQALASIMEGK